jgi:hypothetical protein
MDTERLLEIGSRGIHLLFDTETIVCAFQQDADRLRGELDGRFDEVHFAIDGLVKIDEASEARDFIDDLPDSVRHVLVLLYFELLDGKLREAAVLH